MTKKLIHKLFTLSLALGLMGTSIAQDDDADKDSTAVIKDKKENSGSKKALKAVPATLSELPVFNAKPDLKAKYYIYLVSASWCGPCQALMPKVVNAYPAMKKKKVELVLLGADGSLEAAKKYVDSHNGKFPAVWKGDLKNTELPGFVGGPGIPWVVFVAPDGKTVHSSVANNPTTGILNWEEILFSKKAATKKPKKK